MQANKALISAAEPAGAVGDGQLRRIGYEGQTVASGLVNGAAVKPLQAKLELRMSKFGTQG
jgi:hypothetical protein